MEGYILKCSICGNEMEEGFIQSGRAMSWVKKPHKISVAPKNDEIEIVSEYNPFIIPAVPAYICKKCKKVLLDYSTF